MRLTALHESSIFRAVAILFAAFVLLLGPFVGFFRDREFYELHVFIKHRPSTTVYFSSPIGEGDIPAAGLPPREAQREAEFVEFVEEGRGYRRSIGIGN